jgi:hypothetical protein
MGMGHTPDPDPAKSDLSAAQHRRLVDLDQHLSADDPDLAHALRVGRAPRRFSASQLALALVLAIPLVVLADQLGGPAPAVVETILLAAWIHCHRP